MVSIIRCTLQEFDQPISTETAIQFREELYAVAAPLYRSCTWRNPPHDPYHILVSEVMLQQTQVARVEIKFKEFTECFPTLQSLAQAPLRAVLAAWSGLGYNRRGVYLHRAAQQIIEEHGGHVPSDPALLCELPGVGPNTAGSIAAFAYQVPALFIETNIRTVFLHTCFPGMEGVSDRSLMPLIAQTLDHADPRRWYYALMDYGASLKRSYSNPSRRSRHHTAQSRFEGSDRQIRGAMIRYLAQHGAAERALLLSLFPPERYEQSLRALDSLLKEGLITCNGVRCQIAE